jgi:type I restriction-modification system DNA methylase subunit
MSLQRMPGVPSWENFSNSTSKKFAPTFRHLGGIFKRLIAQEERHKFGQHYTSEDLVDVVNAFCIRKANDLVLDPACGSGDFLVHAYHRKPRLNPGRIHQDLMAELYGVDVSLFAAHLATFYLAARDITRDWRHLLHPQIWTGSLDWQFTVPPRSGF